MDLEIEAAFITFITLSAEENARNPNFDKKAEKNLKKFENQKHQNGEFLGQNPEKLDASVINLNASQYLMNTSSQLVSQFIENSKKGKNHQNQIQELNESNLSGLSNAQDNFLRYTGFKDSDLVHLRVYLLEKVKIFSNQNLTIKRLIMLKRGNIPCRLLEEQQSDLLASSRTTQNQSTSSEVFGSFFNKKSRKNTELSLYPSSYTPFGPKHNCIEILGGEDLKIQDLVLKKKNGFHELKSMKSFLNLAERYDVTANRLFLDFHSNAYCQKEKEFQRCLVEIKRIRIENIYTDEVLGTQEHQKSNPYLEPDRAFGELFNKIFRVRSDQMFKQDIERAIGVQNFFRVLDSSCLVVHLDISDISVYMLHLHYKDVMECFDAFSINLVDQDLSSDLSLKKKLGFTEITNLTKYSNYVFLGKRRGLEGGFGGLEGGFGVGGGAGGDGGADGGEIYKVFDFGLVDVLSISGTLRAIKILRLKVLGQFLTGFGDLEPKTDFGKSGLSGISIDDSAIQDLASELNLRKKVSSSQEILEKDPLVTKTQKSRKNSKNSNNDPQNPFDDFEFDEDCSMVFDPKASVFLDGPNRQKFSIFEEKSLLLINTIEYNICQGTDFILTSEAYQQSPRGSTNTQGILRGLKPDQSLLAPPHPQKDSRVPGELNESKMDLMMTKDYLLAKDTSYSDALNRTFNHNYQGKGRGLEFKRMMVNERSRNSIRVLLDRCSVQSFRRPKETGFDVSPRGGGGFGGRELPSGGGRAGSGGGEWVSKIVVDAISVQDRIKQSEFKYVLRKTELEDSLPFALEITRFVKDFGKNEKNGKKGKLGKDGKKGRFRDAYNVNLSIPELTMFLTDESSKFMSGTKGFRQWMGITSEIMVSLFGHAKDVEINQFSANETEIEVLSLSKGLFSKPKKKLKVRLPGTEITPQEQLRVQNMNELLNICLFTRFIKGNPNWKIDSFIESIPLAGDLSRLYKDIRGKIKGVGDPSALDLDLAVGILGDFRDGLFGFTECSVTSIVRWANLGGAEIDEENISQNMRLFFAKVNFWPNLFIFFVFLMNLDTFC